MPKDSRSNLEDLATALNALAEQMKLAHKAYAKNLPTTQPDVYWHTLDCNLHTMVGAHVVRDQVQVLELKDHRRVQYLSSQPELSFFVDVPQPKGPIKYLYLDGTLRQKEAATYRSVAEVVAALDQRRAANNARQEADKQQRLLNSTLPPEPPLAAGDAKKLLASIAAAVKSVRARIDVPLGPRAMLRLQAPGEGVGTELDGRELQKALRLELGNDKELGVVRLLRATVDPAELDEFVAAMATCWAQSEQKGATSRWLLRAAGALGGEKTAAILGRYCAANYDDSAAHASLIAALDGLGQMGALAAAHEIYAVATLPSRYTKRRNEARAILERIAGRAGVTVDALVAQSVPRDPPEPDRARVREVQSRRLERMMVDGTRLPFHRLRDELLEHPVLQPLCEQLVFGVFGAPDCAARVSSLVSSFRPQGKKLLDAHGKELAVDPRAQVGVCHAVELAAAHVLSDWQAAWLAPTAMGKKGSTQPFVQLARPVLAFTERQAQANVLYDFKTYRRPWLHEQQWWGFKVDADYMADVDTFAVVMERDGKYIEAKLDGQGHICAVGMGKVELDYDLKHRQYRASPSDPTPFGGLHPVSQSELLYALVGSAMPPAARPAAPAESGAATRYPYAEKAKSSRSQCLVCEQKIVKDAVRIVVEREIKTDAFTKMGAGYVHPECAASCPDLAKLPDLDAVLRNNSQIPWPP